MENILTRDEARLAISRNMTNFHDLPLDEQRSLEDNQINRTFPSETPVIDQREQIRQANETLERAYRGASSGAATRLADLGPIAARGAPYDPRSALETDRATRSDLIARRADLLGAKERSDELLTKLNSEFSHYADHKEQVKAWHLACRMNNAPYDEMPYALSHAAKEHQVIANKIELEEDTNRSIVGKLIDVDREIATINVRMNGAGWEILWASDLTDLGIAGRDAQKMLLDMQKQSLSASYTQAKDHLGNELPLPSVVMKFINEPLPPIDKEQVFIDLWRGKHRAIVEGYESLSI
jgi:hypothetical protein